MAANLTITNARAIIGGREKLCNIRISDGLIQGILPAGDVYGKTYDAKGCYVLPGFIDVHTHGIGGVDFNSAEAKDIRCARDFYAARGVTCFLPTIIPDQEESLLRACIAIHKAKADYGCREIFGIHLEGPFLNPQYRGRFDGNTLREPDFALLRRLQSASDGLIRRVTLSPELEGAIHMIERLSAEGILVSLGHSDASYEQTAQALEAGASAFTHLYQFMPRTAALHPGITVAALVSNAFCEFVCDGLHLHPGIVNLILKSKGSRAVAVSDSLPFTGQGDGIYKLGANNVVVKKLEAKYLDTGARAGSVLTPFETIRCLMEIAGLTMPQCIPYLTENPARLLGIYGKKGSIDLGKDADLVVCTPKLQLLTTFSCGDILYQA